jgi:plasmid maintenance system antidote protein VapI
MLSSIVFNRFMPYFLGIALLVGAGLYIRHDAFNDGVEVTTQKYERAMQVEKDRITRANNEALRLAHEREAELAEILAQRNEEIKNLMSEIDLDPNASRPAISVDSVRRINRID